MKYRVEVRVSEPPPEFDKLEIDPVSTVVTYMGVTPEKLDALVVASLLADPTADMKIFAEVIPGVACSIPLYRGGCAQFVDAVSVSRRKRHAQTRSVPA